MAERDMSDIDRLGRLARGIMTAAFGGFLLMTSIKDADEHPITFSLYLSCESVAVVSSLIVAFMLAIGPDSRNRVQIINFAKHTLKFSSA
ncbi:hypothetical protein SUGI_1031590 [Cryptomeria japonica]|nr:hypothetical protein SUGI_1031590 [Cryptomeria japonica]